jgi:tetratricopeptide (TPR) repeat protein
LKTHRSGPGSKLLACVLAASLGFAPVSFCHLGDARADQPAPAADPNAPTDPNVAAARQHFTAGYQKYQAGDYAGALTEFQAADAAVPAGAAKQYIGLCHEKLGHLKEALAAFDAFEANPGDKAAIIAQANQLKPHIAQLRAQLTAKQNVPYQAGVTKYNAGDYQGALAKFQEADGILSTPQTYLYIGRTQDHLQDLPDAVDAYQKFLANVPHGMEKDGQDVKARVDQIVATPGKVHVDSTPPGATVFVDGQPQPAPTPTDLSVPPGHHHLELRLAHYQSSQLDIDVGFASTQSAPMQNLAPEAAPTPVAVTAPPPVAPVATTTTPPPSGPPQPHSKIPAYITGGLAIAAAGVGTVFGVMALNDHSDFINNPTSQTADDGENHALIADMMFFIAVTLGVTSAVLFFTKDDALAPPASAQASAQNSASPPPRPRTQPVSIHVAPIATPHGGGAGALIRF